MLNEKLKKLRKELGYSQEYVAEKINTARSNISKYETGERKPSIETLLEFCKLYNTTPNYLLDIETTEEKSINNNVSINQGDNGKATVNINNK